MDKNKPLKKIVADNLTELRKSKSLTQSQLGEMLGYTDKAISKWEHGDTTPDLETLKKLADFYGVTIDYLCKVPSQKEKKAALLDIKKRGNNRIVVALLSSMIAPAIFILVYVILLAATGINYWLAFLWWLPIDALILFIFAWVWHNRTVREWCAIAFTWTALTCVYLQLVYSLPGEGKFYWTLFFFGIPATLGAILWKQFKRKKYMEQELKAEEAEVKSQDEVKTESKEETK